ncbi:MAG: S-layer family protein, partial [Cyanothece sp. SIO2G6]|nr:S-layer family protein [Cyanothece sp. SIO2G6]
GTPVGNLTNEAKLVLDAGQQLTLQGNTVVSRGELIAPRGTVQLSGNQVRLTGQAQVNVGNLNIEAIENIRIATQEQLTVAEDLQVAVTAPEGVINVREANLEVVGNIQIEGNRVSLSNSDILSLGNLVINSEALRIRASDVNILSDIQFNNDEFRMIQNSNVLVLGRLQVENHQFLVRDSQFIALDIGDALEEGGLLEELGDLLDDETVSLLLGDRTSTIRDTFNTNNRPRDILFSSSNQQTFDNSDVLVWTLAGQGRNMQLMAEELNISNSSRILILANNDGQQGNLSIHGGQIHISGIEEVENPENSLPNFLGLVNFDDSTAGSLDITADELFITDSSVVSTVSFGREQGGNLDVNVGQLRISGVGGNPLFPSILAAVAAGQANESGQFPSGGNLTVNANEILLDAGGGISTTALSGRGGQILVDADEITITGKADSGSSSGIDSDSYGEGDGGVIIVRADSIDMDNLGDIAASSRRPQGSSLDEDDRALLEAFSEIFSELDKALRSGIPAENFLNDSVDLFIGFPISQSLVDEDDTSIDNTSILNLEDFLPRLLNTLEDRANNEREIDQRGNAGDIFLYANSLSMKNGSQLFARTRAIGDGGNIHISVEDLLFLDESNIATEAGTDGTGGDGGNITIQADNGFIVARVRQERWRDSDIAADAFAGNGGNVNITTQAIFGLEFRDRQDSSNTLNEITASSVFGRDGEVLINTLNVDINRGLVPLPDQPASPEVDDTCGGGGSAVVEFFVVGRGGAPSTPDDMLDASDALVEHLGTGHWIPLEEVLESDRPQFDQVGSRMGTGNNPRFGPMLPICQVMEQGSDRP